MKMLYNRTATIYSYTRDDNMVSTYTAGASFACNIQPMSIKDGFDGAMMYKLKKMYTEYESLKVWEKLVIDSTTYVVHSFEHWKGMKGEHWKAFIQKSEGT